MKQRDAHHQNIAIVSSLAFLPVAQIGCVIPEVCTCCLRATQHRRLVVHQRTTKHREPTAITTTTHTTSVEFYTCRRCLGHEIAFERARDRLAVRTIMFSLLACCVSIMFGMLIIKAFDVAIPPLSVSLSFFLSYAMTALMTFGVLSVVDLSITLEPLDSKHASQNTSVALESSSSFRFHNLEYAKLFYLANLKHFSQYPDLGSTGTITITEKNAFWHPKATGTHVIASLVARLKYTIWFSFVCWFGVIVFLGIVGIFIRSMN